ncbi:MAG: PD-(D/E)XK nuclease family protein, partial [Gammaproteobacteria bacterium]
MENDTLILTVNNRLARELRRQHDHRQAAAGLRVWPSLPVLPLDAWLRERHAELVDLGETDRVLLTPHQERLLWEQSVREDGQGLMQPAAAARTAQDAWQRLHQWRLDLDTLAHWPDEETARFLQWARRFETACEAEGLLSQALLPDRVAQAIGAAPLSLPARIELRGFDSLNPQQAHLIAALKAAGCEVVEEVTPAEPGR